MNIGLRHFERTNDQALVAGIIIPFGERRSSASTRDRCHLRYYFIHLINPGGVTRIVSTGAYARGKSMRPRISRQRYRLMLYYSLKMAITTVLIVIISEISKRSTLMGGVLASIPLISVLAIIWLYADTKNTELISEFSVSVFLVGYTITGFLSCITVFVTKRVAFLYQLKHRNNYYCGLLPPDDYCSRKVWCKNLIFISPYR